MEPDKKFFVFYEAMRIFVRILEYAPYATRNGQRGFSMDKVVSHVNSAYEGCGGILAKEWVHYPTRSEIEGMTASMFWGTNFFDNQIQLDYDPANSNSSFIQCFNQTLTDWTTAENEASLESNIIAASVIGAMGGLLIIGLLAFYIYHVSTTKMPEEQCHCHCSFDIWRTSNPSHRTIKQQEEKDYFSLN